MAPNNDAILEEDPSYDMQNISGAGKITNQGMFKRNINNIRIEE